MSSAVGNDSRLGPSRELRQGKAAIRQDGPPKGGYPKVTYKGNFPVRGPGATAILATTGAVMAWGFYKVVVGNKQRRADKEEKKLARRNIVPVLQAEEDARYLARKAQLDKVEGEIMANVPGWKVGASVYHSKRFEQNV